MLEKVVSCWRDLDLVLNYYKDQKDVFVLGSLEDIIVALDESLVTISTIASSRYVEPLRQQVRLVLMMMLLMMITG
jgi:dynein heavy chain